MTEKIRINRFISQCGIASRRKAEELINQGRVSINKKKAILSDTVDPSKDIVELDGLKIKDLKNFEYHLLYKPAGVLSTASDERGRKTVLDFLPKNSKAVPVGRLDLDTTGVLLLMSDGELHYRLTHPSFEIKKVYKITVAGEFTEEKAKEIMVGIEINGLTMKAKKIVILNQKKRELSEIIMTLAEGRKREVKELLKAVDCRVVKLERIVFANITCHNMKEGETRSLTKKEVKSLYKLTGLDKKQSPPQP
ncbi:MAG: pseudouridine synthase [bacterium]